MAASRNALGTIQWARSFGSPLTDGNYYFVGSAVAGNSNGNTGLDPAKPLATVAYALTNLAVAGDVIIALPRHTESVSAAAGWDFPAVNVEVWGMSYPATDVRCNRSMMPVITLDTATTADIDFDFAGCALRNLRIKNGKDSLAAALDVNAAKCQVTGCIFDEPSATLRTLLWIDLAATSTEFVLADSITVGLGAETTVANKNYFMQVVTSRDVLISGCDIWGNYNTTVLGFITGACLNVRVVNSFLANLKGNVGCVNDGNQAHTGRWNHVAFHCDPTGGSPALATAVVDISNAVWTFSEDCTATNDNAERAAAIGTAST